MIFKETGLKGAYLIELEKKEDERGFFARSFCEKEFEAHNLELPIRQSNISYNKKKGALRGIHYQAAPYEEIKLVSCVRGKIYDVIVDLRKNSSTFRKWLAFELNAQKYSSLYIPKGFAHGFQSLVDDTVVLYQMCEFYHPEFAHGIRWDDPIFMIKWPLPVSQFSQKDNTYSFW